MTYRITGQFPATDWDQLWWRTKGKLQEPLPWEGAIDYKTYDRLKEFKGRHFELLVTTEDTSPVGPDEHPNFWTLNYRSFTDESDPYGWFPEFGYGAQLFVNGELIEEFDGVLLQAWSGVDSNQGPFFEQAGLKVIIECSKSCSGSDILFGFADPSQRLLKGSKLENFKADQLAPYVWYETNVDISKAPKKDGDIQTTVYVCSAQSTANKKLQLEVLPVAIEMPRMRLPDGC